ncbi:MAG: PIN domain-containing protein [Planctomycetaceae bacterium]
MEPIEIFIETSALPRGMDRDNWSIERLVDLVNEGLVRIHLSAVGLREWESQIIESYLKDMGAFQKAIRALSDRRFHSKLTARKEIDELMPQLEQMKEEAHALAKEEVQDFVKDLDAQVIAVGPDDGQDVIASYFAGSAPFAAPKRRDDFPDAFIFCAVRRLAQQVGSVLCVCCPDKNLAKALRQLKPVEIFDNLPDLLRSPHLAAMSKLPSLWTRRKEESVLRDIMSQQMVLEKFVRENAAAYASGTLVWIRNILPRRRHAEILGWRNADRVDLHFDERFELGVAQITFPFELFIDLDLRLECYIDGGIVDDLPAWVNPIIHEIPQGSVAIDDLGTGVTAPGKSLFIDAQGTHACIIQGLLMLNFSENDLLKDHVNFSQFRLRIEEPEVVLALGPEDRRRQWTIYKTGAPPKTSDV